MRADLLELRHQVDARVQAAGGVDEDDVAAARLARGDRVEHDRGRIGAALRADEIHAGARRPDLQLLDRRGAERVGRADERRQPRVLDHPRQLADRRRLAGAVDADDQHDVRLRRSAIGFSARLQDRRGSPVLTSARSDSPAAAPLRGPR